MTVAPAVRAYDASIGLHTYQGFDGQTWRDWHRLDGGNWTNRRPHYAPPVDLSRVTYQCADLQRIEHWHRWRNPDGSLGGWVLQPRPRYATRG
jgi:hypothetical protein